MKKIKQNLLVAVENLRRYDHAFAGPCSVLASAAVASNYRKGGGSL
jgi:hypothetical protein